MPVTFLSLGANCQPAYQIRIRQPDAPRGYVDSLRTGAPAIRYLIESDFDIPFGPDDFRFDPAEGTIRHNHSPLCFLHDFRVGEDWRLDLEEVCARYVRRADTWRKLLNVGDPILFVNVKATVREANELAGLIDEHWPLLPFRILSAYYPDTPVDEAEPDPRVVRAALAYPPDGPNYWKGDSVTWDSAFELAAASWDR